MFKTQIQGHLAVPMQELESPAGSSNIHSTTPADTSATGGTSGQVKPDSLRSVSPGFLKSAKESRGGKVELLEPAPTDGKRHGADGPESARGGAQEPGAVKLTTPNGSTHTLEVPPPTDAQLLAVQIQDLTRHIADSAATMHAKRQELQGAIDAFHAASGPAATAAGTQLAALQGDVNQRCFDLEGAAAELLALQRPGGAGGPRLSVSRGQVHNAIDLAAKTTGAAKYAGVYPDGLGGQGWPDGAPGIMDRASVTYSALRRAMDGHVTVPGDAATERTAARLDASRQLLLQDLAGSDAALHGRLSALAETHHLEGTEASSSAPSATAQALATALADGVKRSNNPVLSAEFAGLQADADRCAELGNLIGHSDFKRELDTMHANKGLRFYAQAMGGSVIPSAIAASLHSLCANVAGDGLSNRADYEPDNPAHAIAGGGAVSGAALGLAVPVVNNGLVPSVIGALELVGARTLKPTDAKRVYPAAPQLVVDAQLQPSRLPPATHQPQQQQVLLQRDNFIKEQSEHTFGGATGKTIGYLMYGIGNGARVMFDASGTLSARVVQTGASQALATSAMTLLQANQTIRGYPAYGLSEAQGWDRVKKGAKNLDVRDDAALRNLVGAIGSGVEAIYVNKAVNKLSDLPGVTETGKGVVTGVAMAPLLVPIFAMTEENKALQHQRAEASGVIDSKHDMKSTTLTLRNLKFSNWNGEHRDHVHAPLPGEVAPPSAMGRVVNATTGALATGHGVLNAASEVAPTLGADVFANTVNALTGRHSAAPPRRPQ